MQSIPGRVIELKRENATVAYSNNAGISTSLFDFTLQFGRTVEATEDKMVIEIFTSIFLSPQHAKVFSNALLDNIKQYEKSFGEIKIPKAAIDSKK